MIDDELIEVLRQPLAQELLDSNIPVRLAYTAADGTPRVIPIAFHWNGEELIVCTLPNAPKVPALKTNPDVAMTIDTNTFPPHILLIRGTARVDMVEGVPDDYLLANRKLIGNEGMAEFEADARQLHAEAGMARITITPTWAKVLDFETTMPSAMEDLVAQQQERAS